MAEYIEHTADDEMPDCGQCDHVCGNFNCEKLCGPEHGWCGYRRTVRVEVSASNSVPPKKAVFLYNADPNCDHNIVACPEGGVKCTKCNGWFAY